jgi:hypothetical protein
MMLAKITIAMLVTPPVEVLLKPRGALPEPTAEHASSGPSQAHAPQRRGRGLAFFTIIAAGEQEPHVANAEPALADTGSDNRALITMAGAFLAAGASAHLFSGQQGRRRSDAAQP